jgi:oligopeptide transport system ATP-binding protein
MKKRAGSMYSKQKNSLLQVIDLKKYYPVHTGMFLKKKIGDVRAVDGISFEILNGETLGLVGESGCGKTTCGRSILQLDPPTSGSVIFNGEDITQLRKQELRGIRKKIQVIFQDPFGSLNPRMTARDIIGELLLIHGMADNKTEYHEQTDHLFRSVGLDPAMADRYPHEFSGGQRQRIGIARALSVKPELIVCDEPVSALDVSIQAQIINLLQDLQERFQLTYLFIAHDLALVRHLSDRVAVMYLGNIVEIADRAQLYYNPLHPYTKALFSAVPIPDPEIERTREHLLITGEVGSPFHPPVGCKFHPRCPFAKSICREEPPFPGKTIDDNHWVACHLIQ